MPREYLTPSIKKHVVSLLMFISILFILTLNKSQINDVKISKIPLKLEKLEKFEKTATLWRPSNSSKIDSTGDRILSQYNWIQEITNSNLFDQLKPKKILVLDGLRSYYAGGRLNCPTREFESKCELIEDKWWFFQNLEQFDAIIGLRNWKFKIFESKIPPNIRQIIFISESPFVTLFTDFSPNNAILASYYRGSDISVPYLKWISHANSTIETKGNRKIQNYASGKTKMAAIVVSDCNADNRRLDYVKELQKYVQVDVYGRCGRLHCGQDCFDRLKKDYKFYLAFENANCVDYITEKFFENALEYDMVPIVLGARRQDYVYAAPPNSFIHVENFQSPWELASYMIQLDEDDQAYNSYFKWKGSGKFIDPWRNFFCRACALLHYEDFVAAPVWPVGSTWNNVNVCLKRGHWYWDRDL